MEYKYKNQFNLSNELSQSISSIISKKEKENYVCKIITITIPEHEGLIFSSPVENTCGISSYDISVIRELYGKYINGTIPAEEYPFFVVMKQKELDKLSKLSFDDKNKIKKTLLPHCIICQRYFGSFDSRTLIQKFPYLQDFFNCLDEWRIETGRVTVDNNILEKGIKKTLCITKNFRK